MSQTQRRVKAVIAYDGSAYRGFQKQKSTSNTITHTIEQALDSLQIKGAIVGSGRTDAGVHATGQVIHFDIPLFWQDLHKLKVTLNRKLQTIRFKHISEVPQDFHARFSAQKRLYRYIFKTRIPSLFEQKYVSFYPEFNTEILIEALQCFEGSHDFVYFQKTGTETHTTIRKIYRSSYTHYGAYHMIYFQANGFLRSQVRMMVDAAMQCAREELSIAALQEQINTEQKHTSRLAPAEGLYLARVNY